MLGTELATRRCELRARIFILTDPELSGRASSRKAAWATLSLNAGEKRLLLDSVMVPSTGENVRYQAYQYTAATARDLTLKYRQNSLHWNGCGRPLDRSLMRSLAQCVLLMPSDQRHLTIQASAPCSEPNMSYRLKVIDIC